ncbi:DUF1772 domain-containing protein [Agromyces lapidis]|uniref:DUF1772 domain-containing protein n=1 Tax=Agromyces lapidis TaxID=279574 RepID=A0ABV5STC9_9MICO|nr:anthrone oxygenase family protein [Agromyces lapidis]
MSAVATVLLVIAIVGTGLVSGVFFAFSGFVVQGLDRLPPTDAARAMREINVTAVRAPLMLAIFGTALLVIAVATMTFFGAYPGGEWWIVGSAVLYLVGVVGVTGGANVPRNNRLAAAPGADAAALGAAWREFRPGWFAWNHVRWLTSAASCAALVVALLAG